MFSFKYLVSLCAVLTVVTAAKVTFDPVAYERSRSTATCKATRRGSGERTVDIQLKYVDINSNASRTIFMVHGWPSLWSSWSRQIEEFKNDYRLVVPDLRGFGQSTHPGNPQTSGALSDMVSDLVCILEKAQISSAICMGHDWGSALCYEAARRRPDVFTAVVGVVVPYMSAANSFISTPELGLLFESLRYQTYFDVNPEGATTELSRDTRRTLRATLRTVASPPPAGFLKSNTSFLAAWNNVKEIPPIPFFSPMEEEYFVSQYELHSFENTFEFYANENRLLNWQTSRQQGNYTIPQPVLAVYPTQDPVADWSEAARILKSDADIPKLTTKTMPGAHWPHLEFPDTFNAIVREWLSSI